MKQGIPIHNWKYAFNEGYFNAIGNQRGQLPIVMTSFPYTCDQTL